MSAGLVTGRVGLPVAGAIGSACTDKDGSSLPLRRVRGPVGVAGTVAGIPAKTKAQSCFATFEQIRKKMRSRIEASDTTLYLENFLEPRDD